MYNTSKIVGVNYEKIVYALVFSRVIGLWHTYTIQGRSFAGSTPASRTKANMGPKGYMFFNCLLKTVYPFFN